MSGTFEKGITILEAVQSIDQRKLLLPAIQRNFVWSTQQICTLFDSLMRKYPINTFMFWDVENSEIKNQYRFYSFLTNYCQRFKESNDHVPTHGEFHNFKAVIDGQQRLTSIYIGLKGTYAYKRPRVWWPNTPNDDVLPPRKLYLNLVQGIHGEDNESFAQYDFRFLTHAQVTLRNQEGDAYWFEVGEVLRLRKVNSVDEITLEVALPYLEEKDLAKNPFACKALTRLYYLVRQEEVIRFYNEKSQDIDHVLDVFIRTNSGGTPLELPDLLMSIAIANWEGDAREDIDRLVKEVLQDSEMQFSIGREWVLKTCLMLTDADVRFKVRNFDGERIKLIEQQWSNIRACVVATFKLLRLLGLKDQNLQAKNAVIPIAYYLYKKVHDGKPLFLSINNINQLQQERLSLSRWLNMALLKGVFGGQSDSVLSKMKDVLRENLDQEEFPLERIIEKFTATNKDLRFDEAYLQEILNIQYGDGKCRSVLSLLFPEINENLQLDIDHLHPKDAFSKQNLANQPFLNDSPDLLKYYENTANWNSLPNLHLLNASQNRSKKNKNLQDWMSLSDTSLKRKDLLLEESDSLDFNNFKVFCERRREALLQRLRSTVTMTITPVLNDEVEPENEE